ncbi:MAG: hypothetical protein IJA30_06330 [Bacilli bacterium]|jgi:hypothetical protein|nr:hypothetical protein [Bacilli bacterium]
MLELVQLASACGGLDPLVSLVKNGLFPIVYIVIPIALLIYAVIDFGKAVIASDEKEVKAAQSRLIKRAIYAALIFFVVFLVKAIMDVVAKGGTGNTGDWWSCWESV